MTKISIITQNFSSPDVFSDKPLMLLPQPPPPSLSNRDQDGFSQLLLHDLHRHRQSYVRSYTAFETLKKRQDFVLRQENLRSLQNLEQRITTRQDQFIDQSIHSYEQCFVKVINGNLTPNGSIPQQQKRIKSVTPAFDKYHIHQLSHTSATPLDPPPMIPFHRYQKSHRPPLPPRSRSYGNIQQSAQSLHDAFQSSSFTHNSQPFLSFTESYLQKYGDRSTSKFHFTTNNNDGMDDINEKQEDEEEEEEEEEQQQQQLQLRSSSVENNLTINQNKKHEKNSKILDLQHIRATASSRNTNTPSSTPQLDYNDAVRDGLTITKNNENHSNNTHIINEKRRSSQQSAGQISNADSKKNKKRPKSAKKKQIIVNLTTDKKTESSTTKTMDNDLFKSAMFVQNYESNSTTNSNLPTKIERLQVPTNITRKAPSVVRRSSIKSTDNNTGVKQLDNIDTQMKTTTTTTTTTTTKTVEQPIIDDNNKEQILVPITNNIPEKPQDVNDLLIQQQQPVDFADIRKRVKKGAFDAGESMQDLVAFQLGIMGSQRGAMKKNRFRLLKENEDGTELYPENQDTLDLLEKIRQSASGISVGQPPLSQQGCRFELPHDLKLLENLTPLEYLSKYCRLSSRRNYQFKRIFDKYRNNQYRFESNNLYASIVDVHSENFTRSQFDSLCQLIDIGNEQHQFTFDTYAGILALCERLLYESSQFRSDFDDSDLAKDTIEKCDFDSLERKLGGLIISEKMKTLLKTI